MARRLFRYLFTAMLAALVGGFFAFAAYVDRHNHEPPLRSDGIVVLTGGTERIADGARLMVNGYGRRMLISGVHTRTSADDLARLYTDLRDYSTCCVDLGYQALNTRGNAQESRRWAQKHDLRSLIVVTSDYHMPRTIAEFRAAMPGVRLSPHAVVPDARESGSWWRDAATARLLIMEYLKYLLATARITKNNVMERFTGPAAGAQAMPFLFPAQPAAPTTKNDP